MYVFKIHKLAVVQSTLSTLLQHCKLTETSQRYET